MIGCLRTRVRKQPIVGLYFEFENELKFNNHEARILFFLSFGLGPTPSDKNSESAPTWYAWIKGTNSVIN